MRDVESFRDAVRERRRATGRTQQQLARAIALNPHVLSHKLHERDGATLTALEVAAIVRTLAGWGGIASRSEAVGFLALMGLPPQAMPEEAWGARPLSILPEGDPEPREPRARHQGPQSDREQQPQERPSQEQQPLQEQQPPQEQQLPQQEPAPHPEPTLLASPALLADPANGDPPLAPARPPVPLTTLVGRESELAAVIETVRNSRLVTLLGPGGTGKTRVAIEAARRLAADFADGVAFADLASVEDSALLTVALATALGLTVNDTATAERQLAGALRSADLLLVADNVEHLVEEAPVFSRILAASSGVHLLVTSRIPLRLYGEHRIRVPPLSLPAAGGGRTGSGRIGSEAVQLFLERARAVDANFNPTGLELEATARICKFLDGLPLAIELAAAHAGVLLPQDILAQLEARQPLLEGGPRDRPKRQQTLGATLDWSYDVLAPSDRGLFINLAVFAGTFDGRAAAAVAAPGLLPHEVLRSLIALSEQSLVEVGAANPPRFWLLQPVREYALAQLAESGAMAEVQQRHLCYYLAFATGQLPDRRASAGVDELEIELGNIRAALDWSRSQAELDGRYLEEGLRLATATGLVWRLRASIAEGAMYLERLLDLKGNNLQPSRPARAWALVEASKLQCFRGEYPRAIALAAEALAIFEDTDDTHGAGSAHRMLGEAALSVGDFETAGPHFTRQLALATEICNLVAEADACNMLGQLRRLQGRHDDAEALLQRGLEAITAAGDRDLLGSVLHSLGEVARDAGQAELAMSRFRESLSVHRDTANKRGLAYDLEGVATAFALFGQGREALVCLGAAQALRESIGSAMAPLERAIVSHLLVTTLGSFGPAQRREALTEGRELPLGEVIAIALAERSA